MGFTNDDVEALKVRKQEKLIKALQKFRLRQYDVTDTKQVVAAQYTQLVSHQSSLATFRAISTRVPKVYRSIKGDKPKEISAQQWGHLRESRIWRAFEFVLNRWCWSLMKYNVELKNSDVWIRARYIVEYENIFFVITLRNGQKTENTFLMKPNKRLQAYIDYQQSLGYDCPRVSLAKLNAIV